MNKRAQMSVFVIIGIAIVAAVAISSYFAFTGTANSSAQERNKAAALPEDITEIKRQIADCAQLTLEDAISQAGKFTGYTEAKSDAFFTNTEFINYGYNKRKSLPSIDEIEQNMASYIEEGMPGCAGIKDTRFEITTPAPNAKVDILADKVYASIEYKAILKSKGNTYTFSEPFEAEANVEFRKMYDTASTLIDNIAKDPAKIDPEFMLTLNEEIDIMPFDNNNVVYRIRDRNAKLNTKDGLSDMTFVFASMP